jgi:hypothetical protein
MKTIKLLPCALVLLLIYQPSFSQVTKKSFFHLLNPVPKDKMRDMETDRPDVTESPFTVDAGHFQYETDLVKFKRERDEISSLHTILINQADLKLGLTNSTDLQVVIQTFGKQRELDLATGNQTTSHGLGDLTIRLKQNLLGDDKGKFAIAILPYLKFPTSEFDEEERYEGGLIIPMQLKLPNDWKLAFQVEGDRLQNKHDRHLHTEFLQSIALSHEILKGLDGIAETLYTYDFKHHQWANFLNAAMQLSLAQNFKLDAGFNYGVQTDAEKTYFIGTSFRF